MKHREYEKKLVRWEAEGYDVSELREKWFPAKAARGKRRRYYWAGISFLILGLMLLGVIMAAESSSPGKYTWYFNFIMTMVCTLPFIIPGIYCLRRGLAPDAPDKPSEGKVSSWRWFLPVVLGFIGGIISWVTQKNTNLHLAKNMLTVGIIATLLWTMPFFAAIAPAEAPETQPNSPDITSTTTISTSPTPPPTTEATSVAVPPPTPQPALAPTTAPAPTSSIQEVELKYDDGTSDGSCSVGGYRGFLVHFSPSETPFTINSVKLFTSLRGTGYDERKPRVEILNNDFAVLHEIQETIASFNEQPGWVTVDIPNITINNDFYVFFYTNSLPECGVYMHYDLSTPNENSEMAEPGGKIVSWNWYQLQKEKTNWMIRVTGASVPSVPSPSLLYEDDFSNPDSGWAKDVLDAYERNYVDGEYVMAINIPPASWGVLQERE